MKALISSEISNPARWAHHTRGRISGSLPAEFPRGFALIVVCLDRINSNRFSVSTITRSDYAGGWQRDCL
jgi:hypothetical protein